MATVLLVIHLMIAAALCAVVLLQRSEGGALGIGSSGGAGGFMTGRGTANMLTRVTAGLAAAFFVTSITLTLLAQQSRRATSPLDRPAATAPAVPGKAAPGAPATGAPAAPSGGGLLDSLQQGRQQLPQVPANR
ncbi:MAG: preprotein translocase subunit SecG [Alphaproteobacteria bacterium 64-6]|uniref:preprotein translocase subunit SecG n=1 Tax=Hyphomicrobium sp. CS1BSMeth3 TaxID=1892844 RepID=UPI000930AFE2|nr:preprotein translocase subunit SecG [Hyphomicrobium sp. CS1BSMeth3]MBN9267926.1 preprotein translocase subunit SecG [Hyphomicrobium sp.]OJU27199.1 MAG: preprotein translocase subunit SecG [Alphaproteobacteria bacterium 64-6]